MSLSTFTTNRQIEAIRRQIVSKLARAAKEGDILSISGTKVPNESYWRSMDIMARMSILVRGTKCPLLLPIWRCFSGCRRELLRQDVGTDAARVVWNRIQPESVESGFIIE